MITDHPALYKQLSAAVSNRLEVVCVDVDALINLFDDLRVTDMLLQTRQKLLDEVPPCQNHGAGCVPHAIEWVKQCVIAESMFNAVRARKVNING